MDTPHNNKVCAYCNQKNHNIKFCDAFLTLAVRDRAQIVKERKLCPRCLGEHKGGCFRNNQCRICKGQHHSHLHQEMDAGCYFIKGANPVLTTAPRKRVLLATALVKIGHPNGNGGYVRALIDPGSQVNLVTEHAVNVLSLPTRSTNTSVSGLGGHGVSTSTEAKMLIQAHFAPI